MSKSETKLSFFFRWVIETLMCSIQSKLAQFICLIGRLSYWKEKLLPFGDTAVFSFKISFVLLLETFHKSGKDACTSVGKPNITHSNQPRNSSNKSAAIGALFLIPGFSVGADSGKSHFQPSKLKINVQCPHIFSLTMLNNYTERLSRKNLVPKTSKSFCNISISMIQSVWAVSSVIKLEHPNLNVVLIKWVLPLRVFQTISKSLFSIPSLNEQKYFYGGLVNHWPMNDLWIFGWFRFNK